MSRNGTLLALPDDPWFPHLIDLWPSMERMHIGRAVWLGTFERTLREHYPQASRADLNLTARHYAPFPLAAGHDVP